MPDYVIYFDKSNCVSIRDQGFEKTFLMNVSTISPCTIYFLLHVLAVFATRSYSDWSKFAERDNINDISGSFNTNSIHPSINNPDPMKVDENCISVELPDSHCKEDVEQDNIYDTPRDFNSNSNYLSTDDRDSVEMNGSYTSLELSDLDISKMSVKELEDIQQELATLLNLAYDDWLQKSEYKLDDDFAGLRRPEDYQEEKNLTMEVHNLGEQLNIVNLALRSAECKSIEKYVQIAVYVIPLIYILIVFLVVHDAPSTE